MTDVTDVTEESGTRRRVKFTRSPKKSDLISLTKQRMKFCHTCGCRLCETEVKELQKVLDLLEPLISVH